MRPGTGDSKDGRDMSLKTEKPQDKLGTMPVGRLLVSMSVPMMISMFVQALYNMVDSMFVAQLSENALTAVSLTFPLQNMMAAVAVGTGVGTSAMLSRALGEGDTERADRAANVQVTLSAVYTVILIAVGLLFSRGFFAHQTDVEEIIEYGHDYMLIVCVFAVGGFFGENLVKLLTATGNSAQAMVSQAAGAVVNIVFDPLLIFGLGPFPALGVSGAAWATVLGQCVAALLALFLNQRFNRATRFRLRSMTPDMRTLRGIYAVGLPSMITIGLGSAMSYLMNQILLGFSTTAAAVFGIWMKMQSFGFMPVFGMNNGTIAIYSYNYGAKQYDRVRRTLRLAMAVGIGVTAAWTAMYELLPVTMLRLFNASEFMLSIGVTALRLCSASLPLGAVCVILSSSFQSLGRARYTLLISVMRQLVFQVPAAWLLALGGALELVWLAPVIAEGLSAVLAAGLSRKVMARLG